MTMGHSETAREDLGSELQPRATCLGSEAPSRAEFAAPLVNSRKKDPKILQNEAKFSFRINKTASKTAQNEAN